MVSVSYDNARRENALAFAALLLGALAMGISPIFVRLADVGPFTRAFWRVTLALPALYAWMRIAERGDSRAVGAFHAASLLAGLAFTGDLLFWHLSILTTSIANATFFATTAPVWVIVFGWLLFRERVTAWVLAGLALCLLGGCALLAESLHVRQSGALGDLEGLGDRRILRAVFPGRAGGAQADLGGARHFRGHGDHVRRSVRGRR